MLLLNVPPTFGESTLAIHKKDILGERTDDGVRVDVEVIINEIAGTRGVLKQQFIVFSRAMDSFMIAETGDEAYNAYLLMTASRNCSVGLGYGENEINQMLLKITEVQINTNIRKMGNLNAEKLNDSIGLPALDLHEDYLDYCKYTQ